MVVSLLALSSETQELKKSGKSSIETSCVPAACKEKPNLMCANLKRDVGFVKCNTTFYCAERRVKN